MYIFENEVDFISDGEDTELPELADGWDFCTSASDTCTRFRTEGKRHEFFPEDQCPEFTHGNIVEGNWKSIELGTVNIEKEKLIDYVDELADHEFLDTVTRLYDNLLRSTLSH